MSILASLFVLGAGVYAASLTEATSTANTFASANPHLQISSDGTTFTDSISAGLNASHISPGHDQTAVFYLKNTGDQTLSLNTLFNATGVGNALGLTAGHLQNDLQVGIACVDHADDTTAIASIGSQGFHNYEGTAVPFTGAGTLTQNQVAKCTLTASLAVTTDSGQNLVYNATFGGN